ncbi:MAG: hypothetical protein C0504_07795 [Candidatus Solibacter sp.]|nr:hypothetical protein [Candidatus Solibacter sp.]
MRRLNLCIETQDTACVLNDGKEILRLSGIYDSVIFMYYEFLGTEIEDTLKLGLPETARPLRSYAVHIAKNAKTPFGALAVWDRLRALGLADEATASRISQHLVENGEPAAAWRVWRQSLAGMEPGLDRASLLTNGEFKRNSAPSPFDWAIRPQQGVTFLRHGGLQVLFHGETNLSLNNVSQLTYIRHAHHRLVVEVSHEGLTTNQGPFISLVDAEDPSRLSLRTESFHGASPRRRVVLEFKAPRGTRLVRIQLERTPSEKFDNKIAGALHLHRIALTETAPAR